MMISPEMYIMEHQNDTFSQLLQERDELVEEIRRLEKFVFDDNHENQEEILCPSPEVEYQVNLEYLAELCIFISNKYNREIVWGGDDWGEEEKLDE